MIDRRFYDCHGPLDLDQVLKLTSAQVHQAYSESFKIHDVAPLDQANDHTVTVLHNTKYQSQLAETKAGACFVTPANANKCPPHVLALVCPSPYRAFALTAQALYPDVDRTFDPNPQTIHPSAEIAEGCILEYGVVVHAHAKIGQGTRIGAHSVIGRGVQIGKNCVIESNVTITHALVEDDVIILTGVRIGQAGFGFFMDESGHVKVPQLGRVIVHQAVEIGANTTIDRGSLDDTIIGQGCRIDNLVQIAHNVHLGRGCVVVSQVGIAGSTKVGNYTIIAGQVGIAGHLNIGQRVKIAAQSGVMRDIGDGEVVAGSPAIPVMQWHRQTIKLKNLIAQKEK